MCLCMCKQKHNIAIKMQNKRVRVFYSETYNGVLSIATHLISVRINILLGSRNQKQEVRMTLEIFSPLLLPNI